MIHRYKAWSRRRRMRSSPPLTLNERIWFGFTRQTWFLIAFVFLTLVNAFGLRIIEDLVSTQHHQSEQALIDRCNDNNRLRGEVRALIEFSYSQDANTVDLTQVPSFHDLDPATQQYMTDLSKSLSMSTDPAHQERIARAERNVQNVDCSKL